MRVVTFFSGFFLTLGSLASLHTAHAVISQGDKNILLRIGSEINRGNYQSARQQKHQLSSKSAQNYVEWRYLTDNATQPSYLEIARFVKYNQDMPKQHILREKLEKAIIHEVESIQKKYFLVNDAVTIDGKINEIRFLFEANRQSEAQSKLEQLWFNDILSSQQTQRILANFRPYLRSSHHSERIKRLLDKHYINDATNLLPYATDTDRQKLNVRTNLIRLNSQGINLYHALNPALKQDAGVLRSLVHYYRKTNQDNQAIAIIANLTQQQSSDNPVAWANHRIVLSRVAFKHGQKNDAYKIVASNYLSEGADFVDAEFYAGWLALRYLGQSNQALKHFQKARAKSMMPISISRFEYWIGRSCKQIGNKNCATTGFSNASNYANTFYGQLSGVELSKSQLNIQYPPQPDNTVRQAYFNDNTIQAAYAANAMGNQADAYIMLLSVALRPNKHPAIHRLLEDSAKELTNTVSQVKLAKTSSVHHHYMISSGYPINSFTQHPLSLERSLVFALTRQESEFDSAAQSPVGARGLMQLMPATASGVARKLGVGYDVRMLTQNPNYNMQLGSKYLYDMVMNFNGSYIHALSAYNAGPGRVPQWNNDYGRFTPDLYQIIDRIEIIPFPETRNYVQRILESLQVYRAKFSGANSINVNNLVQDLKRGT